MNWAAFKPPAAWFPLLMSAASCAVVTLVISGAGAVRDLDEGVAAHVWQLLVIGQVPLIAWSFFRRWPQSRQTACAVLAVHMVGLAVAAAPVALLGL